MLSLLVRASLEGAILAAGVWVVCRALPRLSPAARSVLWWCVAAKFVVALLWRAPIAVPVLPPITASAPTGAVDGTAGRRAAPLDVAGAGARADAVPDPGPATPAIPWTAIPWTALLVGVWGLGLSVSLSRAIRSWRRTRAMISRSLPGDAAVHAVAGDLSRLLGLRRAPDVRVSTEIASPLITGLRRPVVLVPANRFPSLSRDQQRMALCHELAHVRRGDLWLGCVPAAVERCFFFHPLASLAAREYGFWREVACDVAVLTTLGASPQSYGRLLLALGESRRPAAFAAAGAAWTFTDLKRRITMLSRPTPPSLGRRVLAGGAMALTILAIVPVRAVARTAGPSGAALPPSHVDAASISEIPSISPAILDRSAIEGVALSSAGSPQAAAPSAQPTQERRSREELRFVYFRNDSSTTMSGSSEDIARARRHLRAGEPMLWFRRDGREYVVRDRVILGEVEELWAPVSRIGEEQGRLGARQGALGAEQGKHGARQSEIGSKQGAVGARQGAVGARLGELAAREAAGVPAAERGEIEREREALHREMRQLDREMEALGDEMREIGTPMRGLGEEMAELGRQMSVLGGRMRDASRRADAGMRTLVERAIRSGAAEAVP